MRKSIGILSHAALAVCVALAGWQFAAAQEPPSQDKLGQGAVGKQKPLPEETGPAPGEGKTPAPKDGPRTGGPTPDAAVPAPARDPCSAKTPGDVASVDILKTASVETEAAPAPPPMGGGGGGGGGRRGRGGPAGAAAPAASDKVAYDYELPSADGKGVPLCNFKGKTLLVVNVARNSSYASQIAGLEKLSEQYKDQGLVVIGVPSDEFGAAEPGKDAEIQKIYTVDDKVTFPIMAKSEVTGDKALPLFDWLAKAQGGAVKWNFTKFFIDKNGKVVARFDPAVAPDSAEMQAAVVAILAGRYKAPGTGDVPPTGRRGGGGMPPAL